MVLTGDRHYYLAGLTGNDQYWLDTGTIPYTGVPLPFISYGGTSLVISMAAVGVLLNISRYIQEPEDPAFSTRTITKTIQLKRKV